MAETSRILVAGGAGFLGAALCRRLLEAGHSVVCVDNLLTGSRASVAALAKQPRFTFIEHDVIAPLEPAAAGALDGLDSIAGIYNLACAASPLHYQRDPVHTLKTCVLGAANLLDLARARGARLVQASTSEVYGDPLVHPQDESYRGHVNPIGPRACYDEGKRAAEALCFDMRRQHGVRIGVARIFNTYGPGMDPADGRVVSNFIQQALRGEPLTLYGHGQQTRSFCYVDDLLEGLVRLMDAPDTVTGPINLGNPTEFTVAQLAQQVLELTGSASTLEHLPLPEDDPQQRRPAIKRAQALLGWQPKVPLHEGLARTIEYFRTLA